MNGHIFVDETKHRDYLLVAGVVILAVVLATGDWPPATPAFFRTLASLLGLLGLHAMAVRVALVALGVVVLCVMLAGPVYAMGQ